MAKKSAKATKDDQPQSKLKNKAYNKELERLQFELVKLQYWIKEKGLRVVITFDGRDAAAILSVEVRRVVGYVRE